MIAEVRAIRLEDEEEVMRCEGRWKDDQRLTMIAMYGDIRERPAFKYLSTTQEYQDKILGVPYIATDYGAVLYTEEFRFEVRRILRWDINTLEPVYAIDED